MHYSVRFHSNYTARHSTTMRCARMHHKTVQCARLQFTALHALHYMHFNRAHTVQLEFVAWPNITPGNLKFRYRASHYTARHAPRPLDETPSRYTALRYITPHHTTLSSGTVYYTSLNAVHILSHISIHSIRFQCMGLHCSAQHHTHATLQDDTPHDAAPHRLRGTQSDYAALHYTAPHNSTLRETILY